MSDNSKEWIFYIIQNKYSTYAGVSPDPVRRLRQHNGEIKGGARATTMKVNKGETWRRACYVEGFPTWSEALKFEWAWKFYSRKLSKSLFPLDRRKQALNTLISLEKPTSKAIPYTEWEKPINVVWE